LHQETVRDIRPAVFGQHREQQPGAHEASLQMVPGLRYEFYKAG